MRLPSGWKENDECVELFLEVRRKMKIILATECPTESVTPSLPLPLPEPVADDCPDRLGKFMSESRVYIERGSDRGRNWYALGGYLVRMDSAESFKNHNEKDDFLVTDRTRCRNLLQRIANERNNDYKLRPFRY